MGTVTISIINNWTELIELWLKSMGAIITRTHGNGCGTFTYNHNKCKWSLYDNDHNPLKIDIARAFHAWADIDLNIEHIDIYDPSFDPDVFFEPFKEWLEDKNI